MRDEPLDSGLPGTDGAISDSGWSNFDIYLSVICKNTSWSNPQWVVPTINYWWSMTAMLRMFLWRLLNGPMTIISSFKFFQQTAVISCKRLMWHVSDLLRKCISRNASLIWVKTLARLLQEMKCVPLLQKLILSLWRLLIGSPDSYKQTYICTIQFDRKLWVWIPVSSSWILFAQLFFHPESFALYI